MTHTPSQVGSEAPTPLQPPPYPTATSNPCLAATASTVSGLAAGAAVVALSALGGFPDLAAAEAPAWVLPTKLVLDPVLLYFEVAFVARIILSWYPKVRHTKAAVMTARPPPPSPS